MRSAQKLGQGDFRKF